jgi:hypothetical protein
VDAGLPWIGLRVIVDPLGISMPGFTRAQRASYVLPALRYALSGPRAVLDLVQLGARARRASAALEAAVRSVAPALAAAEARA